MTIKILSGFVVLALLVKYCYQTRTLDSAARWPSGKFGLPKPKSGCPGNVKGVWREGWRYQDLGDACSVSAFHMDLKLISGSDINRTFCMKTAWGQEERPWPTGSYCVYKSKGTACPAGMNSGGTVKWDDLGWFGNKNSNGGVLPDGEYDKNTLIHYCCQTSGNWFDPVKLPVGQPFYLLTTSSTATPKCQMVEGAFSLMEYITFDTSDFIMNRDKFSGHHVFVDTTKKSMPTMYYCYYQGCQHLMSSPSGSFKRVPNEYSYHCSWLISVLKTYVVSLFFKELNIPSCDTSFIKIFDGKSDSAPLLGTYCGANASASIALLSSTNQLFVVVKTYGFGFEFSADYHAHQNASDCHFDVFKSSGVIESPFIPAKYPYFPKCSWMITVSSLYVVTLNITYLHPARHDTVKIYDGDTDNNLALHGNNGLNDRGTNHLLVSSSNAVLIVVHFGNFSSENESHVRFAVLFSSLLKTTEKPIRSTSITDLRTEGHDSKSGKQSRDTPITSIVVGIVVGITVILILIVIAISVRRRKRTGNSGLFWGINPSYSFRKKAAVDDGNNSEGNTDTLSPQEKIWVGGSTICKESKNPIYEPALEQEPESIYTSTENAPYEPLVGGNEVSAESNNPLYDKSDVTTSPVYAEPTTSLKDRVYDEPSGINV